MKSGYMVITLTREGQGQVYMGPGRYRNILSVVGIYANAKCPLHCQLGEYLRVQAVGCGTLRQKAANELH